MWDQIGNSQHNYAWNSREEMVERETVQSPSLVKCWAKDMSNMEWNLVKARNSIEKSVSPVSRGMAVRQGCLLPKHKVSSSVPKA